MTLEEFEQVLAALNRDGDYTLFGAFTYDSDEKVFQVYITTSKFQQLIDTAARIKSKKNKSVKSHIVKRSRLK